MVFRVRSLGIGFELLLWGNGAALRVWISILGLLD